MYPAWDNDGDTHVRIGLSIQTNNHEKSKYPRKIGNMDNKEKEVPAVEEGLQVDMHVFTKNNFFDKGSEE